MARRETKMLRDLEPCPKSTSLRNQERPEQERENRRRHENHLKRSKASVDSKRQNQGPRGREYWKAGFDFIAARIF